MAGIADRGALRGDTRLACPAWGAQRGSVIQSLAFSTSWGMQSLPHPNTGVALVARPPGRTREVTLVPACASDLVELTNERLLSKGKEVQMIADGNRRRLLQASIAVCFNPEP